MHAGSDTAWLTISAQPILDRLANEIADTCYLARLVGHEVISVAWATPNDGLRGYVVPGHTLAPHVAASAKAILAFQPQALADEALSGPLPKLTAKTKTKRKDINEDYRAVRENGYATCWDEMEIGLGAIAVPIHLPLLEGGERRRDFSQRRPDAAADDGHDGARMDHPRNAILPARRLILSTRRNRRIVLSCCHR